MQSKIGSSKRLTKGYIILENLLLKCALRSYAYELETVFSNYSEFQREQLPQQLEQFSTACRQVEEKDFHYYLMWRNR